MNSSPAARTYRIEHKPDMRPGIHTHWRDSVHSDVAERFWAKVDRSAGPNECWPWTANRHPRGYGKFGIRGRLYVASRVAWEIANNAGIPSAHVVMHSCDNPPCCNPAHLSVGTVRDNWNDALAKGRAGPPPARPNHPFCGRGHPQVPENRVRDGRGSRCRLCRNLKEQRHRRRTAESCQ